MKIFLLKEPSLLREGITSTLDEMFPNHNLEAFGACDVPSLTEQNLADLMIIDLDTVIDIKAIITFYKRHNKKVIVWTSSVANEQLPHLFKLELDGYFFNGMEREELYTAIVSILRGEKYIHQSLASLLLSDYVRINNKVPNKPVGVFSDREWEVLQLLGKGYKNEQIGKTLFLSEKTVKTHVSQILRKMQVPDRTNAVLTAIRNRWLYV